MPEQRPKRGESAGREPRARSIVAAARRILEEQGSEALTMQRLGEAVGIRAPSLYKHFQDKSAVELALIDDGFEDIARAFERAFQETDASFDALAKAYRGFAHGHPSLYRLMTSGPLPRDQMRPGVETPAAAPLLRVIPDPDLARGAWAWAHGMTILELDGRFPPDADLDSAWATGIAVFETMAACRST